MTYCILYIIYMQEEYAYTRYNYKYTHVSACIWSVRRIAMKWQRFRGPGIIWSLVQHVGPENIEGLALSGGCALCLGRQHVFFQF